MGLNPSKGNMYGFVTHTWNTVKGKCHHDCEYCYMKRWGELKPVRFDEKELKEFDKDIKKYGKNLYVFVGSSNDMFNKKINREWIDKTLECCSKYKNKYLFQSKNPSRMTKCFRFPKESILCTTIESNRNYDKNNAPEVIDRASGIQKCKKMLDLKTMVTIEPIMDFDLKELLELIKIANPDYINIGAVTGISNKNFPEPSKEKIEALIEGLKSFDIKIKTNLKRIY